MSEHESGFDRAWVGKYSIWRSERLWSPELAVHLEQLGFAGIWMGGSPTRAGVELCERILDATTDFTAATGVVNIWTSDPVEIAGLYHRIEQQYPGRFLLGIGAGHREASGDKAVKPFGALVAYLDVLKAEGVPASGTALAALGPRVLRLAADRTEGAHPYLVTPEHTRFAREILGEEKLLVPEQHLVLTADPGAARALGRQHLERYLSLANYTNNFRRLGFTDEDLALPGSDRFIDDIVVHGDDQTIAARIDAHLDAGADQVALQLLTEPQDDLFSGYEELARILKLG